jgi:hypothetical protein
MDGDTFTINVESKDHTRMGGVNVEEQELQHDWQVQKPQERRGKKIEMGLSLSVFALVAYRYKQSGVHHVKCSQQ